jgi:hypothetical protein
MPIWKLTPIDRASHHWKASTHCGQVHVRAGTEDEARRLASQAFCIGAKKTLHESTIIDPWEQAELVSCEENPNSGYSEAGQPKVLSPNQAE